MKIKIAGYEVIIDDKNFNKVNQYNWRLSSKKGGIYFEAGKTKRLPKRIYLHRFLINCPDNLLCDHIDGNTLKCTEDNLRPATYSQNNQNRKLSKVNKSGYKGVSWNKVNKKWEANIKYNGKTIYLGYYDDPKDAHKAYCEKAKELFGAYARFK